MKRASRQLTAGTAAGSGTWIALAKDVPHPYTAYPELLINFCPTGMIPANPVARLVLISEEFGRPLASRARAREMLGLGPSPVGAAAPASKATEGVLAPVDAVGAR